MTPSCLAPEGGAHAHPAHPTTPTTILRPCLAAPGQEFRQLRRASCVMLLLSAGLLWPLVRQRMRHWLLAHTEIDGEPLQLLPEIPGAGLRLLGAAAVFIAVGLLLALASVALGWEPRTRNALAVLAALPFIPWLWVREVRATVSRLRWRAMRLDFRATAWEVGTAFWPLALGVGVLDAGYWLAAAAPQAVHPAAAVIAVATILTLMVPCLEWRLARLVVDRTRWAGVPLQGGPTLGACLRPTLVVAIATLAVLALAGALATLAASLVPSLHPRNLLSLLPLLSLAAPPQPWPLSLPLGALGLAAALLVLSDTVLAPLRAWRAARVLRAAWDGLAIEGFARVRCDLDAGEMARLACHRQDSVQVRWARVCSSLRLEVEAVTLNPWQEQGHEEGQDTLPLEESVKRADTPDSVRPPRVAAQGT